jgi:hypothetical protein
LDIEQVLFGIEEGRTSMGLVGWAPADADWQSALHGAVLFVSSKAEDAEGEFH